MNHKEKLLSIHQRSLTSKQKFPSNIEESFLELNKIIENQKGLFTVLITSGIHKSLNPSQDIRYHQASMRGGYSGRTVDTKFITPTLRELGLPCMKESGWLSRTLEINEPYDKNYPGKIKTGKRVFLSLIDFIQNNPNRSEDVVERILFLLNDIKDKNKIELKPLKNPEILTVNQIINSLDDLLKKQYKSSGGAKLPVLAVYAVLKVLIKETKKYENSFLKNLGSHTSADAKSKSSGDIEIFKKEELFESFEIKLNVLVDINLIRSVREKIYLHNPKKYYILSEKFDEKNREEIFELISKIKLEHGCEIYIDKPLKLIKRFLLLINKLDSYITIFNSLVSADTELKIEHKEYWQTIYEDIN